jgi:hypothetical protein
MNQKYLEDVQSDLRSAYQDLGDNLQRQGIDPRPLERLLRSQVEVLQKTISEIESLREEVASLKSKP